MPEEGRWPREPSYIALPVGTRQSLWHGVATTQAENCIFMAELPKSKAHDYTLPTCKEGASNRNIHDSIFFSLL